MYMVQANSTKVSYPKPGRCQFDTDFIRLQASLVCAHIDTVSCHNRINTPTIGACPSPCEANTQFSCLWARAPTVAVASVSPNSLCQKSPATRPCVASLTTLDRIDMHMQPIKDETKGLYAGPVQCVVFPLGVLSVRLDGL